jgi:hypothetical protein
MELTTSQAVQKYRVFPNALHRLILIGRLKGRKVDGRWLIEEESLERWNRSREQWNRRRVRRPKARSET